MCDTDEVWGTGYANDLGVKVQGNWKSLHNIANAAKAVKMLEQVLGSRRSRLQLAGLLGQASRRLFLGRL